MVLLEICKKKLTKNKYKKRAPKLWDIILKIEEKLIENPDIFKTIIRTVLVLLENAFIYFWCIYKTLNCLI